VEIILVFRAISKSIASLRTMDRNQSFG
jgi:hypothetical protein